MELIDKVTKVLKGINDLKFPIVELRYDNQGNIVGYLTDEIFERLSDEASQKLIWDTLKRNLDREELLKIIAIFHETSFERVERINKHQPKSAPVSNFWFHETPELAKYWLFMDVAKFDDDYKAFYFVISEKNNMHKGLTLVYNREVINFMELEQEEIYSELFLNIYKNAEVEVKLDLMNKYESFESQHLYGRANIYWYVYENFRLKPITKKQLLFTEGEILKIEEGLKEIDNFAIKKDIIQAIDKSKLFNNLKSEIL